MATETRPAEPTAKITEAELIETLKAAAAAAVAADPGEGLEHDGGTSNFDTPAFRIAAWRHDKIEQAAAAAGLEVTAIRWLGHRWYWLHVSLKGQGNRRSTMMGAAQRVLNAAAERFMDFGACGYQQSD